MECTTCGFNVPHNKAPDITFCNICQQTLQPSIEDIFENKMFDIIKEHRPTQQDLANCVTKLLKDEDTKTLLAQGGTGIGKTYAYLIPMLLHNKERTIISTATKALQTQLANKDIPYLLEKLDLPHTHTIYKGKANYACWKLEKEVPKNQRVEFTDFIKKAKELKKPADLSNWGDEEPKWWAKVNLNNCPLGNRCEHHKECRPQPADCKVVITNHHLTSIDMKISPGFLLGKYNSIVFDEAHKTPDAFRSAFTNTVNNKYVSHLEMSVENDMSLTDFLDKESPIKSVEVKTAVTTISSLFETLHQKAKLHAAKTNIVDCSELQLDATELKRVATNLEKKLSDVWDKLLNLYDKKKKNPNAGGVIYGKEDLLAFIARINRLKRTIANITQLATTILVNTLNKENDGNNPNYTEANYNLIVTEYGLETIPKNVGKLMTPLLNTIDNKVLVSATLAINNDFTNTKDSWGLNEAEGHIIEEVFKSPFNLHQQTKLYLPLDLPMYSSRATPSERKNWVVKLSNTIAQLIDATNGNTFVLFASRKDMMDFYAELNKDLKNTIFLQEGDAALVLKKYLNTPNSVLFGLKSFWEGVDIPGNKLMSVIIPRLPFPNPFDPVFATLCEGVEDAFNKISVPHMIFEMKQGVGRLIRRTSDYGIISILDVRTWTGTSAKKDHQIRMINIKKDRNMSRKGYGQRLLNELGLTNFHYDFKEIANFIKKIKTFYTVTK